MMIEDEAYEPTPADIHWLNSNGQDPQRNWQFLNLADPQLANPPDPPAILGLLYAGKRHVISGAPESAKTLIAYILLLEALRKGNGVAIIDFEMGAYAARQMLVDLGATTDELANIVYTEPDRPPATHDMLELVATSHYVLIDAGAGAYDTTGLDDNQRKDVEQFARIWTRPLWKQGIATILVDHVTKNVDTRGKFAIGSERKLGGADIHLGLEAIKSLTRGTSGLVRVTVHKDRPGFLTRPTVAMFELHSDPEDHTITYAIKEHEPVTDGWKPTFLMERVSIYLEQHHEPVSRTQIETNVKGKSVKNIRQAIDALVDEGYASEIPGARNSRNVSSIRPYRHENTTPSHPVPPRPDGVTTTPSDWVPPTGAQTGSDSHIDPDPVPDGDGVLWDDDIPF